ncbi:MAG: hypothetical protein ACI8XM_000247 [Haloarculaceae archaeon]|jgi:hypothetical protein
MIPEPGSESETSRDGVLSTLSEYHALILGLVVGYVALLTGAYGLLALTVAAALGAGALASTAATSEIRKEPWYTLGGLAIGAGVEHYGAVLLDALLYGL